MYKAFLFHVLMVTVLCIGCTRPERKVWTTKEATDWYAKQPWLRGTDFIPSTAINQLEMWQAATFDTATIDRELGYAEGIGLNSVRVYLHHIAWQQDPQGFKQRMDKYLSIADKHHISTLFVFFDDCWNDHPQAGTQPAPKPGIHNSGWVRDPGSDILGEKGKLLMDTLHQYVTDVLNTFKDDKRVVMWDVYNEPGNSGYGDSSMNLLQHVFSWGREVALTQPLTAGVWDPHLVNLNAFQLETSDVITYHNYNDEKAHQEAIDSLRKYNKPLICTEYMARTRGSHFANILPLLHDQHIGAYSWGLVSGKTNTKYAWSDPKPDGSEPAVWFHDIFHPDGSPYDSSEVQLIRKITGVSK
ncbi:glycoside hydrolase family 2 TIM barrel-domain containing protein [Chitinophaga sp. Cy-1792]|uniref:glycoside hydrolase family 2 TIM barrel-domain containing protein n=1 Tax=Chitinophaga sp. Cy-1792 TaxID=2608339 RepID=UPI0014221199|nr:glycoside hydrolase family 2 TIM barrel-domain containing protein [Chitinophaga sp. Cy-1792]NIG56861.1 1,4-beta-xylanase [Chitinophaga sp. Cy-1792]